MKSIVIFTRSTSSDEFQFWKTISSFKEVENLSDWNDRSFILERKNLVFQVLIINSSKFNLSDIPFNFIKDNLIDLISDDRIALYHNIKGLNKYRIIDTWIDQTFKNRTFEYTSRPEALELYKIDLKNSLNEILLLNRLRNSNEADFEKYANEVWDLYIGKVEVKILKDEKVSFLLKCLTKETIKEHWETISNSTIYPFVKGEIAVMIKNEFNAKINKGAEYNEYQTAFIQMINRLDEIK